MHPHEIATSGPSGDLMSGPAASPGSLAGPRREAIAEFLLRPAGQGGARPRGAAGPRGRAARASSSRIATPTSRPGTWRCRSPAGRPCRSPSSIARMLEALALDARRAACSRSVRGRATRPRCWHACLSKCSRSSATRSLATQARTRLEALGIGNAAVVWGDGLAVPPGGRTFRPALDPRGSWTRCRPR